MYSENYTPLSEVIARMKREYPAFRKLYAKVKIKMQPFYYGKKIVVFSVREWADWARGE